MAITIVGAAQTISTNNGGGGALTFIAANQPIAGDVTVVMGGVGTVTSGVSYGVATPAGYTLALGRNTGINPAFGMWYKVQGATPDTAFTFNGSGVAADSSAYLVVSFRGVDNTTPLDSTPSSTTLSNPQAVTVNTSGSLVIAAGGINNNVAPSAAPTGYTLTGSRTGLDTNAMAVGVAHIICNFTGSEDPGAFTWTMNTAQIFITACFRVAGAGGGLPKIAAPGKTAVGIAAAQRSANW